MESFIGEKMNTIKLPSNSETILFELVQSDNPTIALASRYKSSQGKEKEELKGIIRELKEYNFIQVRWADNLPYSVTLNNSARTYFDQISENEQLKTKKELPAVIFISHRSTDKRVADMLVDFLIGTGIPRNNVFCSSLPGNDINEKISDEVKNALKNSAVNIAILSSDYYESAFCLNEAGVLWYSDVPVIPIAMPEITPNNMFGFLNSNYKLRRLDSDTDVSYIYDTICEALAETQSKASVVTAESNKLQEKYNNYLTERSKRVINKEISQVPLTFEITTDDEKIVLYYILKKAVRKVTKSDVMQWLNTEEIYNVNIDNAFDLLSSFDNGKVVNDTLEFGIQAFRQYTSQSSEILPYLKECVKQHTKLAIDSFQKLWTSFDSKMLLFTSYIIDERMNTFGDRWKAEGQIKDIKRWEEKCNLNCELSSNYGYCLEFFVQNGFVYASDWTGPGNVREYTLCPSLMKYLFYNSQDIADSIQHTKNDNQNELSF